MFYDNNPVKRLYDISSLLKTQSTSINLNEVFSNLFLIEENDRVAQFSTLIDLVNLGRSSVKQIESIADISERYIKPVHTVQNAILTLNLDSTLHSFKHTVTDQVLYGLEFSCDMVEREFKEVVIDHNELVTLQKEVEDLINNIIASQLPSDLKNLFIERLELIRKSFVTIRITGVEGVKQALELSAGALFLNRDKVIKNNEDSNVNGVIHFMDKLNTFVSVVNGVKELAIFAGSLLLGAGVNK